MMWMCLDALIYFEEYAETLRYATQELKTAPASVLS